MSLGQPTGHRDAARVGCVWRRMTVATAFEPRKGADMHARIAAFKGEPAMADRAIEAIRGQVEADWESPPEGLESAKELLVLLDREGGTGLGITLFETEE